MGDPIARVTVDEARDLLVGGRRILFVDARRTEDWELAEHQIPGSMRLAPDGNVPTVGVPEGWTIVCYCSSEEERAAAAVAAALVAQGCEEVYALVGGFDAWWLESLPVEPRAGVDEAASGLDG